MTLLLAVKQDFNKPRDELKCRMLSLAPFADGTNADKQSTMLLPLPNFDLSLPRCAEAARGPHDEPLLHAAPHHVQQREHACADRNSNHGTRASPNTTTLELAPPPLLRQPLKEHRRGPQELHRQLQDQVSEEPALAQEQAGRRRERRRWRQQGRTSPLRHPERRHAQSQDLPLGKAKGAPLPG